jgi:predicted nucleotidyltransferase component of viral defense system
MQDLIKQEQFELEALDRLNSGRFLKYLVFGGGTMLRLCHGLDRFSVDLDFWIYKAAEPEKLFADLTSYLSRFYTIKDAADKFYTLLIELKSPAYPRSLKLEIRKGAGAVRTEQAIAYSRHAVTQVILRVFTLDAMMTSKIAAFLDRKEIRDAYDLEFLVKRGIRPGISEETRQQVIQLIENLTERDYTVKLSSLIEPELRPYYRRENFKILKAALN